MIKYLICPICARKLAQSEFSAAPCIKNKFGVCTSCKSRLPYTDGDHTFTGTEYLSYVISSFYYKNAVRSAMLGYKFSQYRILGEIFSYFAVETLDTHPYIKDFDIIMPIPLSKKRLARRGYNQSAIIASGIAEHFDIAYSEVILTRTANTKKQSTLSAAERASNIRGAFAVTGDLSGMRILLVDDIFTTGSTLNEAARELKKAGAADIVGITSAIVKD